jgi:voltage-gated potassium channel
MIDTLRNHIIVCGFGRVGRRCAEEFREAGVPYVVVDYSPEAVAAARERGDLCIEGSGTEDEHLEQAGIAHARGLVAASDSDADNLYITLSAKAQRPDMTVVARATDADAERKLRLAGADRVVTPYATAGRVMANMMIKPQVAAFVSVLTSAASPELSFEEIEVPPGCIAAGKTIGELGVRGRTGATILAVRKPGGGFEKRPSKDTVLQAGDVLIGVGAPSEIGALEELFEPGS